jgi:hypothetical protein
MNTTSGAVQLAPAASATALAPAPTPVSPLSTPPPAVHKSPGRRWHAHLSALGTDFVARRRAQEGRDKRVVAQAGTSLDRAMLGRPLRLRAAWDDVPAGRPRLLSSSSDCSDDVVGLDAADDGSGRHRWVLRPVDDSEGEYNLLAYGADGCGGACRFLSAFESGRGVNMWPEDDASGRQRWVFRQAGDSRYQVRLAGGKADDKVYLGVDDDGTVRLFSKDNRRSLWDVSVVPYCDHGDGGDGDDGDDNNNTPATKPPAAPSHVPPAAVAALLRSFTAPQIDVVLQLISLPENSTPKWYKNYGYVEFLGDGRGFTATIFGACSGTGDLYLVLQELAAIRPRSATCDELLRYKDALQRKRGDDISGIEGMKPLIKRLGDDPAWREAVWRVYVNLYWKFAMDWADKRGAAARRPGPRLTSAAARGFMVDTAVNHGADVPSLMAIVDRMGRAPPGDETGWVLAFADARERMLKSGFQALDTSRTGDRCRLWRDLVLRNPDLATPFRAYEGYWGAYTIGGGE